MKPHNLKRLCGSLAMLSAFSVQAAGLSVSPPYARFEPGQQTAEVRLTNDSDKPVSVQASAQSWTQTADGVEQESEATDFALYPKVFTVAPGKTQIVRMGRLPTAQARPQSEVAYRLSLRELPVDDGKAEGISVTTRLRLPVWLLPADKRPDWGVGEIAALTADSPAKSPEGKSEAPSRGVAAGIHNRGNVHLRLVDVVYSALGADGVVKSTATAPGWYVLAGAAKPFPVKLPEGFCAGAVKISAVARTAEDSRRAEYPASMVCGRGA